MIWKILGLLLNTLTADERYSFLIRDNLTQPIQLQLCNIPKTFSELLCLFFRSRLNFEDSLKSDDPNSLCIIHITDCETCR